ncbi:MAG: OmpH family outer membrane protein [Gammaproteobacteria bacterium]
MKKHSVISAFKLTAVVSAIFLFSAPLLPSTADAQVKPLKVGFVNVQRLLIESPQANAANKSLENEFAPRQRDLVAKQKSFKDRADKFQKDSAVMGADERRNTENDLRRDERELSRQVDELREDLNNRKNEELREAAGRCVAGD